MLDTALNFLKDELNNYLLTIRDKLRQQARCQVKFERDFGRMGKKEAC
jgi:hypothetical protein